MMEASRARAMRVVGSVKVVAGVRVRGGGEERKGEKAEEV